MNILDNSRKRRMNKNLIYVTITNNSNGHVDIGLNDNRLLENQ